MFLSVTLFIILRIIKKHAIEILLVFPVLSYTISEQKRWKLNI